MSWEKNSSNYDHLLGTIFEGSTPMQMSQTTDIGTCLGKECKLYRVNNTQNYKTDQREVHQQPPAAIYSCIIGITPRSANNHSLLNNWIEKNSWMLLELAFDWLTCAKIINLNFRRIMVTSEQNRHELYEQREISHIKYWYKHLSCTCIIQLVWQKNCPNLTEKLL